MPTRDVYMKVHSIFTFKSPKLGKTKCLITDKWINKLWYVNMIEYSEVIWKKITEHIAWMNLKNSMLRKRNQTQRIICMILIIWSWIYSYRSVSQGRWKWVDWEGIWGSFLGWWKCSVLNWVLFTQMHTFVKKKIIELYILNWYILVYVNYILIKLIFFKGSWAEKEHSN